MSEKTMAASARTVAANKAEAALAKAGCGMTAREVRDACGFKGTTKAARVLGGLVRKGIARSLAPCAGIPRMWFLIGGK